MRNNKVSDIACSAVFVAISVVICSLGAAFPTMSLAITAIAGLASALALIHCGYKYAFLVYFAASMLSLILVPNKECAVYYVFLFGHYPITKILIERIGRKLIILLLKLVEANVLFFIVAFITTHFLGISEFTTDGGIAITLLLFNVAFVLYDICVGRIMMIYISKRSQNRRFR